MSLTVVANSLLNGETPSTLASGVLMLCSVLFGVAMRRQCASIAPVIVQGIYFVHVTKQNVCFGQISDSLFITI